MIVSVFGTYSPRSSYASAVEILEEISGLRTTACGEFRSDPDIVISCLPVEEVSNDIERMRNTLR